MARFQPALLGGLFIGVLSALPLVGSANACCCLWVVVGGLLTAYLLQQNQPSPVETAEAALQGLGAGALGGLLYVVILSVLLTGASGLGLEERVRAALDSSPEIPLGVRHMVLNMFVGSRLVVLVAVVTIPTYAVFGMLGAFLGLAIFRKKVPPAPQG